MSGRLFIPEGPAVTPAERRQRMAEYRAAQQTLGLAETVAVEDGAAWVQASAPFGVWFDANPAGTPTLAEYVAERSGR
jgi:hypothetical protein